MIISHHQSLACFVVGTGQDRTQRDRRDRKNSPLRPDLRIQLNYLSEFSWDEQGFSLMSSLYSDMANFIDEKLRFVNVIRMNHPVRCNARYLEMWDPSSHPTRPPKINTRRTSAPLFSVSTAYTRMTAPARGSVGLSVRTREFSWRAVSSSTQMLTSTSSVRE